VKDPLNYTLRDQKIPENSCFKYLGIIVRSDFSWADQVYYTVQKAWRALHFSMRIVSKENKHMKRGASRHQYGRFSNMGLRAGIHTGNVR
jgi:hypothetical protein